MRPTPRASALYRLLSNIMSEPLGPFYMLPLSEQRNIEQIHLELSRAIGREDISEGRDLEVRTMLHLNHLTAAA